MGRSQKLSELATAYQAAPLTFRNRIINGDMRIDQRNAGASVNIPDLANATYTVDRMGPSRQGFSTLAMSAQQVTDAPAGFTNSLRVTIGTGQASTPVAATCIGLDHRVEGFNTADFAFGTATAATLTLSFWVKASVAGTYGIGMYNGAVNRGLTLTYTINAANTWEFKTLAVPADTTGTWNVGNGIGLGMQFDLGSGTNSNNASAGTWGSTYRTRTAACVTPSQTTGATWQITGLQLEVGQVATPFERRPYGHELALCQRYYETGAFGFNGSYQAGGSACIFYQSLKVTKRTTPTISTSAVTSANLTSPAVSAANADTFTAGGVAAVTGVTVYYGAFAASAEL